MNDQRDGDVVKEKALAIARVNPVIANILEVSTEKETKLSTPAPDMPTIIRPESHDNGSPASTVSDTIYLTDGELIPWKKTWWKVQLREIDGEKIVTLLKGKATAKAQKRSLRAERWNAQHANRKGVKREIVAAARLLKSMRSGGVSSGSQESRPVQSS